MRPTLTYIMLLCSSSLSGSTTQSTAQNCTVWIPERHWSWVLLGASEPYQASLPCWLLSLLVCRRCVLSLALARSVSGRRLTRSAGTLGVSGHFPLPRHCHKAGSPCSAWPSLRPISPQGLTFPCWGSYWHSWFCKINAIPFSALPWPQHKITVRNLWRRPGRLVDDVVPYTATHGVDDDPSFAFRCVPLSTFTIRQFDIFQWSNTFITFV